MEQRRAEQKRDREGRILRPLPFQKDDSLGRQTDRRAGRVTWRDGGQQLVLHFLPFACVPEVKWQFLQYTSSQPYTGLAFW